jgi:glutaredoxin
VGWLGRLRDWLLGGTALAGWRVTLYTRRGCHLCDAALGRLRRARRRYGFAVDIVDVDEDAGLRERYGLLVPVVAVNGKVRFRGGVNAVLLERLLRAEAEGRRAD